MVATVFALSNSGMKSLSGLTWLEKPSAANLSGLTTLGTASACPSFSCLPCKAFLGCLGLLWKSGEAVVYLPTDLLVRYKAIGFLDITSGRGVLLRCTLSFPFSTTRLSVTLTSYLLLHVALQVIVLAQLILVMVMAQG